jgi:hypothetical protein
VPQALVHAEEGCCALIATRFSTRPGAVVIGSVLQYTRMHAEALAALDHMPACKQ